MGVGDQLQRAPNIARSNAQVPCEAQVSDELPVASARLNAGASAESSRALRWVADARRRPPVALPMSSPHAGCSGRGGARLDVGGSPPGSSSSDPSVAMLKPRSSAELASVRECCPGSLTLVLLGNDAPIKVLRMLRRSARSPCSHPTVPLRSRSHQGSPASTVLPLTMNSCLPPEWGSSNPRRLNVAISAPREIGSHVGISSPQRIKNKAPRRDLFMFDFPRGRLDYRQPVGDDRGQALSCRRFP